MSAASSARVRALQSALKAEQAASYGYGVVGAHLSGTAFSQAAADCTAHERARDALTAMITALGVQPAQAAAAYQLPISVGGAATAARLAVMLEHQVAASYLGLVAVPEAALRGLAAMQMQASAVRAARWGGPLQAFPGLA